MAYYLQTDWPVGPNTGYGGAANLGNQYAQMYSDQLAQQYGGRYGGYTGPVGSGSGGTSGSGSAGAISPYNLPAQYQQAYDEAKATNEQRYNDILTGYQDRTKNLMANQAGQTQDVLGGYENRYQRGMANLQGLGDQQLRDTSQRYDQMQAANQGDLVSRGLTSSTILPTMRQGVERQRSDALNRVNEQLQRERLGYDASLSGDALQAQMQQYDRSNMLYGNATGDTLGFAERRSDPYPDFNQLAALAQAYGAAGGQGGGIPSMAGVPIMAGGYQMPNYQTPGGGGYSRNYAQSGPHNVNTFNPQGGMVPMEFNGVSGFGGGAVGVDNSPITDEELWMMGIDPATVRGDRGAGSPVGSPQASPTDSTGMYDAWGNLVWNPNAWGGSTQPTAMSPGPEEFQQAAQVVDAVTKFLGHPPRSPEEAAAAIRGMMSGVGIGSAINAASFNAGNPVWMQ